LQDSSQVLEPDASDTCCRYSKLEEYWETRKQKVGLLRLVSYLGVPLTRFINSDLRRSSVLKQPIIDIVTVLAEVFLTPRMTIHMCLRGGEIEFFSGDWTSSVHAVASYEASIKTATPSGSIASTTASAISRVSRSWIWSLLEYSSAILASLLRPMTFPLGMYAM